MNIGKLGFRDGRVIGVNEMCPFTIWKERVVMRYPVIFSPYSLQIQTRITLDPSDYMI